MLENAKAVKFFFCGAGYTKPASNNNSEIFFRQRNVWETETPQKVGDSIKLCRV